MSKTLSRQPRQAAGTAFAQAPRRPRLSRLDYLLLAAMAGVMVLFIAVALHHRNRIVADAGEDAQRIAALLEEHAYRAFVSHRGTLLQLDRLIRLWGLDQVQSQAFHDEMTALAKGWPDVGSLWVIDRQGALLATSHAYPASSVNFADREYYAAFQAGRDFAITAPILGRQIAVPLIAMMQSHIDRDGARAAILVSSMNLDYFQNFYSSLQRHEGEVLALVREDGVVLVQNDRPVVDQVVRLEPVLMNRIRAAHDAPFTDASDGIERLYSVNALTGFPVYVVYGLPLAGLEHEWLIRVALYGAVAAACLLVIAWLGWLARQEAAAIRTLNQSLDARVRERTATLETALAEKDSLIREVHHRVKNNLQIIASMLNMQGRGAGEATRSVVAESLRRIRSMGLVHEQLYQTDRFASIDFNRFLTAQCASLFNTFGIAADKVACRVEDGTFEASLDEAIPLALLANEAIANALKHAFPGARTGMLTLAARAEDGRRVLTIRDDGVGYDPKARDAGVGLILIEAFAQQLDAELRVDTAAGTTITVVLKDRAAPTGATGAT